MKIAMIAAQRGWRQVLRTYFVFAFTLACAVCHGAESKPLLVILEENPWLMVIGSDSPTFALYDDGTVLYLRDKPTPKEPFHTRKVADAKQKAEALLSFDASKMKSRYDLSAWTDQVTTVIWTPTKKITIYGGWRKAHATSTDSDLRLKAMAEREKNMWESLPSEIREALLRVDRERAIVGTAWLPTKIEVMFWPYEYAPEESIVWPKEWPGLAATDSRKRGEDSFSVFLPTEKLSELRTFLKKGKPRGAVLIDGKKMAESHRLPFPGEAE
jgi:hypothetical protein